MKYVVILIMLASCIGAVAGPNSLGQIVHSGFVPDISNNFDTEVYSGPPIERPLTSSNVELPKSDKLELPVKCILLDGDDLPMINANLEIPGILENNFFHKSKSNGAFDISGNEVRDFPVGVHDVYVTAVSGNGTTIHEIVSCEFSNGQTPPYVIQIKTELTSPQSEERPSHINIVLKDAGGNPQPDLWIMTKRIGERPSAGYLDEAYGYTNDTGTFIWWNALPGQYNCTVYSDATYDPTYQLGSFLMEIKDRDHSYEYCFQIDIETV